MSEERNYYKKYKWFFKCFLIYIYIYICMYIYICVCICVSIYKYIHVCLSLSLYIYIYTWCIRCFQPFFVWAFKIVVHSWKFSILLLYILWDDWPILMISGSNEHLQQVLKYTLLKLDCHSLWISKMQSDILEEWYAIKLCFKLWKNTTEMYGMLQTAFRPYCMNRASVFA